MLLFENQTTDGDSDTICHKGGSLQVQVDGTFDIGASVTLFARQDNLSFLPITNGVFSSSDIILFDMEIGTDYKFTLAGALAGTSVSVSVL